MTTLEKILVNVFVRRARMVAIGVEYARNTLPRRFS